MAHRVISIIMGGGRGTRLYPLTAQRAKPAVPIGGKYRLIDIPISNCLNSEYNRIFVLTQFNSESLNRHIKNTYNFDMFGQGFVDILAAEQTYAGDSWFEGTADAVRRTQNHLNSVDYDYILILSGDHLYHMDYSKMVDFHIENGGDITIATIPVTDKEATGFGILKADEDSQIVSFIEKPAKELLPDWTSKVPENLEKQGRNYLASMGIYVFSREVLLRQLNENQGMDFGKEIIPDSINKFKVLSYNFDSYWADIGTIKAFYDANISLTDDLPPFNLFGDTIYTRARILPPSKMTKTKINRAIISDGCIILAESIERSVIGVRARIGEGTVIKHSYAMGSDSYESIPEVIEKFKSQNPPPVGVGVNCYIERAILDKDCRVGNNVTIKGGTHLEDADHDLYAIRDGIIVIKKGAVIPPGTVIG